MRRRLALSALAFGAIVKCIAGCEPPPHAESVETLEEMVVYMPPIFSSARSPFSIQPVQLRNGIAPDAAAREIVRYLRGDPDAARPAYRDYSCLYRRRARDYWALILADIVGVELSIGPSDDERAREAAIAGLLRDVEALGAPWWPERQ